MNTKYIKSIATLMLGAGLLMGSAGCTDKFEDFNTDPKAPTPEQMEGDFSATAALLNTMMPVLVLGQENDYQMIDQMVGCEFGRMTSAKNAWGTNAYYATYNPPVGWVGNCFDTNMPKMYTSFFQIRRMSGTESLVYYWANLMRIAGTLRVSDTYGPTPFSMIGTGTEYKVAYDDMPDLFDAMFAELDETIEGLKTGIGGSGAEVFGDVDFIYGGDIAKWVKYANTVKLRLAMRLVNVNPTLAKQKAEEAVSDNIGVITDVADAAWSTFLPGTNSFRKVNITWNEGRISADLTSYMNGYSDPRLPVYANALEDGSFVGLRSGIYHADLNNNNYSTPNVQEQSPLLSISASEAWFSRAEGALRGWSMGGTAKELYETGIETSMKERGASIGDYLSSTAKPANYTDPNDGSYSMNAVSTVCPAYDESASFETNLERIIVQKWIGNYPNGWESWADFRRTGYPKWFPVVDNLSTDGVTDARGMRRLPFPQSEFNTNETNVKAAVQMLGGPDNSATDLWWALKK